LFILEIQALEVIVLADGQEIQRKL